MSEKSLNLIKYWIYRANYSDSHTKRLIKGLDEEYAVSGQYWKDRSANVIQIIPARYRTDFLNKLDNSLYDRLVSTKIYT